MSKPEFQWTEPVVIEAGRTCDELFSLYQSVPGSSKPAPLVLNASSVVRFKLSAKPDDVTPLLDVDNVTPLTGQSLITIPTRGVVNTTPAQAQVRFAQADTAAIEPGEYFGELGVVDAADANPTNAFKRAAYGVVIIKPSPGGNVGLTP